MLKLVSLLFRLSFSKLSRGFFLSFFPFNSSFSCRSNSFHSNVPRRHQNGKHSLDQCQLGVFDRLCRLQTHFATGQRSGGLLLFFWKQRWDWLRVMRCCCYCCCCYCCCCCKSIVDPVFLFFGSLVPFVSLWRKKANVPPTRAIWHRNVFTHPWLAAPPRY